MGAAEVRGKYSRTVLRVWAGLGRLCWCLKELLEMWSKYGGELVRWHPLLASMEVSREMFYLLLEFWRGGN